MAPDLNSVISPSGSTHSLAFSFATVSCWSSSCKDRFVVGGTDLHLVSSLEAIFKFSSNAPFSINCRKQFNFYFLNSS